MTSWSNLSVLLGVIVTSVAIVGVLFICLDRSTAAAIRRWLQRRTLNRLRSKLPAEMAKEKQRLLEAWESNPASQCALVFKRFKDPPKKVPMDQLAKDVDSAIVLACGLFGTDFLDRYGDLYDNLLVLDTQELSRHLAAQQSENSTYVLDRLEQDDEALFEKFDASIRQALDQGRANFATVQTHLEQLRVNVPRFHRLLVPSLLSKLSHIAVGALTGAALGAVGIHSPFMIFKSAQFTAGKWADWKGKSDEEFGNQFVEAMEEVRLVCESIDTEVRRYLVSALDEYLHFKLQHQQKVIDILTDLSRAKWDVGPSIVYYRSMSSRTRATR